jgi:alpha-tubulin suppressor-like RCC1 family protein
MRERHLFGVGAAVLLVGTVVTIAMASVSGAAPKPPKPTVSGFAASPSTLYNTGGIVTLSATVANADSCVFSSTPPVDELAGADLPATVACTSGAVTKIVALPANTGRKAVKYSFKLAVSGTKTVKAKAVKVTVGTTAPPPLTGVSSVASDGNDSYCAVLSNGGVDCSGDNSDGQLGNGTFGGTDGAGGFDTPTAVTGITDAVAVTSGSGLGYCAVLSTGGVDCWGDNSDSEIGNGTTDGPDDTAGYDTPQAVTGITDAVSVTSNDGDSDFGYCAVLSTGGVDCWGANGDGQLGNGTIGGPDPGAYASESGYNTPQAVTGITDATSVTGVSINSENNDDADDCAVLSTGGVDCWGDNVQGQLGNGTTDGPDGGNLPGYDTPQAVTGITDAVAVTSGSAYGYCAVLSTGGVDCWGDNSDGEIGNGTTDGPDGEGGYDVPQAVTGITEAVSVTNESDTNHSDDGYCAVLSTDGVDCWGGNLSGEIGNGTTGGPDGVGGYDTPQAVSS